MSLLLVVLIFTIVFISGFRMKTQRPSIIIEATRPFSMPEHPKKLPHDLTEIPSLARPVYLMFDVMVWSGKMSGYFMLSSSVRFANSFAYWSQLTMDLLLRSLVRAWYRSLELTKAFSKVIIGMVSFASVVAYRLAMVLIFPLVAIVISAVVGIAFANATVAYITGSGLAFLVSASLYAVMMYLLCVIVVGLLARCHPSHIIVTEAFQAFSFQLPNFLLLILGTSIVLSVFGWATGLLPYRFGFLSITLTLLVVALFIGIIFKSRKKQAIVTTTSTLSEPPSVSTPTDTEI